GDDELPLRADHPHGRVHPRVRVDLHGDADRLQPRGPLAHGDAAAAPRGRPGGAGPAAHARLLPALPADARPAVGAPAGREDPGSGLSDTMAPGNVSDLIKSERVAFRVTFPNEMPPYQTLYWRGPVLVRFDGTTWRMVDEPIYPRRPEYSRRGRPVQYIVDLEP